MELHITLDRHNYTINIYQQNDNALHEIREKYATVYLATFEDEFLQNYTVTQDGFTLSNIDYNLFKRYCRTHHICNNVRALDAVINLLMCLR